MVTCQFRRENIELVDNTTDEILEVVLEMERRLSGCWIGQPEDEELQQRFRSIWPVRPAGYSVLHTRVGSAFLRDNRELLQ